MWGQKLEYMKSSLTCNFRPTYATILTPFIFNLLQRIMLELSDTGFPYMWSIAFVWWHFNNIYIYISQTVKTGYENLELIRKISTFFWLRPKISWSCSFLSFYCFYWFTGFHPACQQRLPYFPASADKIYAEYPAPWSSYHTASHQTCFGLLKEGRYGFTLHLMKERVELFH